MTQITQALVSSEVGLCGHPLNLDDVDRDGIYVVYDRRPRSHNWHIKCRSKRTGHLLILARLQWEVDATNAVERIYHAINANERQIDVQREIEIAVCQKLLGSFLESSGQSESNET